MNLLRSCIFLFACILLPITTGAQTAFLSGIINHYASVTALDTCLGKLLVSDTAGFKPGTSVLLIQMQGAEIASGNNALFGSITTLNQAGLYERALIDSVSSDGLWLHNKPVHIYDAAGKWQVVSIPQYADAVVTDTLRPQPWNGETGGVLAFEVSGALTLNAPVLATGAGFRGGAPFVSAVNNCNFLVPETAYFYAAGNWRGAPKGEGIAEILTGKELGRGPQANGGGGGNDHNSGGGGGGNIAAGGTGGDNDEPSSLGCDGYYPGIKGYAIPGTPDRIFMGGGGGAGHANNNLLSGGGHGGGIIFIKAGAIDGASPLIEANGADAPASNGDGAGGGGAGGTIRLEAGSAAGNLAATAHGGRGGNTFNNNQSRCFGPGGGGGGGRILTNQPGIPPPQGGSAGLIQGSVNGCNGTSGAASAGQAGMVETLPVFPAGDVPFLLPEIIVPPQPTLVCAGEPAVFSVQANGGDWSYQWQVNAGAGWINVAGPGFAGFDTNTLLLQNTSLSQSGLLFRCIVQKSGCFSVTSTEALLTVETVPVANFSYTVLAGGLIQFSNLSLYADGYFWDFGDGSPATDSVDVSHQYTQSGVYTVTLTANNPCGASVLQVDIQVLVSGTDEATIKALDKVRVFPNPAAGHLILEYPAAAGPLLDVQVFDATGKCLYDQNPSETGNVVPLGDCPSGVLLVRLTFSKGVATRVVVKR